ncbi:ABC transporter ATP-binding protein [Nitratifractor salsuginis]|uniref:ABC transporter related protein n=1 Tax=Nitratifractor salsuginis (strain DSM 16511 / JCM 12458 / E9I37-1) TaxID=749222 RepID=E6WYP1_NITSE|nr:ABC transporter ATP-binding protein [Nitratifractor salsuginis]ADV45412.1 ABC transporter related protein [Nitratifractor salsuginis DSM 16511]
MIRLEGVEGQAGSFHLGPIDLSLPAGAAHALLGPSGAGKSTLLRMILGLETPQKGRILFKGEEISHRAVEERGFGYLPQHLALFPHLSVEENLRYGLKARKRSGAGYETHLKHLIDATGIAPLLDRRPETLSGGERQRVALVRALAPKPELLLLDEPFSALDPALRRELWHLTRSLQEIDGTAMLIITHDMQEAFALADRLHLIIDGTIRQEGTPTQLWEHPHDAQTARYLGVRNFLKIESWEPEDRIVRVAGLSHPLYFHETPPTQEPSLCAIRPESIEITENEEGSDIFTLPAEAFSEPGGTLWRARLGNGEILEVRESRMRTPGEKRELHLRLPPEKLLLYP